MAKHKKNRGEEEVLIDVGTRISSAERFFEENRKSITVIAVALFAIVGGYFAYVYLYQQPREEEAQEEISFAQQYFEQDSLRLAVQGDGRNYGFLDIADEYAGTKAGNLAHYYAGVSYLQMGKYKEAIAHLDEFDSNDPVLSVIAKGAIGDAFAELGQFEEAQEYYERAVSGEENSLVVPFYMMKAGHLAEELGNYDAALEHFTRIKEDFKDSQEAADIKRHIARVEAKKEA